MLKWNTIIYNNGKIEYFNIFRNILFREAIEEIFKTPEQSREEIEEQVKRKAQWQFWSRCEYEVMISEWPPSPKDKTYKLDVFEQLKANWERFIDYIYDCYCSGDYVC